MALEALAQATIGNKAEAELMHDQLLQLSHERHVPPYHIAIPYNGLNELAEALTWLERGFEQHDPKMVFLKVDPRWKNLRGEPRYQNLLKRMQFVIRLRGRNGFCEQCFRPVLDPGLQRERQSVDMNAVVRLDEH